MNEKSKQSIMPEQPFFWEDVVLVPVLVGACICIFFALLPVHANRETCVLISLEKSPIFNLGGLVLSCIKLSAVDRSVLLLLGSVCILPYYLLVRKDMDLRCSESWVKLGLVFGIAMLFVCCTAAPESYYVNPAWFLPMKGASYSAAITLFDRILKEHPLITAQLQSRLLLTSPHSILLPLILCLIVQLVQRRGRRTMRTFVEVHLIVLSLIIFGSNAALHPDYHWIYYAIISVILLCWDHLRAKPQYVPQAYHPEEGDHSLLIHGIALLALYGCTVAMYILEALGMYERGNAFSSYEIAVSIILCLWLGVVLLAAKNRTISGTVLPLYLLAWFGFVFTFFRLIYLRPNDILRNITPYYPDAYDHTFPLTHHESTWALTSVACTIYAIYFLYDHGLKHRPRVIVGVTTLLIVSMYIPEYEFIPQTCVTLCALRNLLLGAIAPILVILVGISPGEPKFRYRHLGRIRLTKEKYISTLTDPEEQLQNAATRNTRNITRSYGLHINDATGNITTDYDYRVEGISSHRQH